MSIIARYRLKKDLPMLAKGVIFEHRKYDFKHPDWGNVGCGVMMLAWNNGNCQYSIYKGKEMGWCGETFILPGQVAEDKDFFELIQPYKTEKEILLDQIDELKKRVENF